ncbi:MAG TPA: alpha-ketoglutarate-dependent dioxygenase AlkB [Flavobacteriaceae bacterium]|jgi:alkylated DNA repair dioxygenase AlkB|nr:alpha-ketoglutarate-dependent dioxygenase AlkB [Flavobacteriaceae bacterium]HBR55805.1 alpha-ketoglutarate-dependent dioxygenase AlkB [Flavobacteriaceae bacterium]HIB48696.1 alpha-ketoglutarate-dependent dioxygenase AlkB [Flavobacteriaceae bacterium]HIN99690.1 alpha-ketoglutarate-dependent dioxygenase AlkB [Flavobacteriaceae bacterium]|tara:strand:+ start:668 stop:1279 length:612 start_codon:yes stop_codon:yes gene_type:complete
MDLFSSEEHLENQSIQLPNADITYYPNFISAEKATTLFRRLEKETPWQHDSIKIFGKTYMQPRLTALFGDAGTSYSYSNITMHATPYTPLVLDIKNSVEAVCNAKFNIVLLNLYRDGQDSNGWHSDDEKELGQNPLIASVSLGAKRKFQLRHKKDKKMRQNIELEHGSLLLMKGSTQHFWQHQIPKTKKIVAPRINLTFRLAH